MADYTLDNTKLLYEWMETHDPERSDKLLAWARAVCDEPEIVVSGELAPKGRRPLRTLFYSDIPGANTRVVFTVIELPVRCVHLLRICDDEYGLA